MTYILNITPSETSNAINKKICAKCSHLKTFYTNVANCPNGALCGTANEREFNIYPSKNNSDYHRLPKKYLSGEISSHVNGTKIKVEFLYPDHIYLIFVISIVIAFAELFSKGIVAAIPLFIFVILLFLISNTLNKNLERELEDSFERIVGEYIISKEEKI